MLRSLLWLRLPSALCSEGAGSKTQDPGKRPRSALRADLVHVQTALRLDEEVEVGARELVVDVLEEHVGVSGGGGLGGAWGPGLCAVLGGVGEGEGAGVEKAVGAHEAQGHRDRGAQPAPVAAEGGYVWHHAHQGPRAPAEGTEVRAEVTQMTCSPHPLLPGARERLPPPRRPLPVHGFGLHVPKPNLEPRMEVLTVELQRGHVTPTAQLRRMGPGGVAVACRPPPPTTPQ